LLHIFWPELAVDHALKRVSTLSGLTKPKQGEQMRAANILGTPRSESIGKAMLDTPNVLPEVFYVVQKKPRDLHLGRMASEDPACAPIWVGRGHDLLNEPCTDAF